VYLINICQVIQTIGVMIKITTLRKYLHEPYRKTTVTDGSASSHVAGHLIPKFISNVFPPENNILSLTKEK
jgi:hypothetical protein